MTRQSDGQSVGLEEALAALLDADSDVLVLDDADDELVELTQLASALRETPAATPDPVFRTRLRARIVEEAAALEPAAAPVVPLLPRLRARAERWRRSAALTIASAMSATAIGGAGVAVAAEYAQPDDVLHGVKRVTESLRLRLADDRVEVGLLHLGFAERRLSEVEQGARTLPADTLIDTLERMDAHAEAGANALLDVYDATGDQATLAELARFVDDQSRRLSDVIADLPVQVVPFANRSLEIVRLIEVESANLALHGCVPCVDGPFDLNTLGEGTAASRLRCCPDATSVAPGTTTPGDGEPATQDDVATAPTAPDVTAPEGGTDASSTSVPGTSDLLPDDLTSDLPTQPLDDVTRPLEDTVTDTQSDVIETSDEVIDTADDLVDLP